MEFPDEIVSSLETSVAAADLIASAETSGVVLFTLSVLLLVLPSVRVVLLPSIRVVLFCELLPLVRVVLLPPVRVVLFCELLPLVRVVLLPSVSAVLLPSVRVVLFSGSHLLGFDNCTFKVRPPNLVPCNFLIAILASSIFLK